MASLRQHKSETDATPNSGYGSSDETASLLVLRSSTTASNIPTTTITHIGSAPLIKMSSINGPTTSSAQIATFGNNERGGTTSTSSSSTAAATATKPVLMRQDRTSTYLASPQLSQAYGGGSEESAPCDDDSNQLNARSVPDLETQYRLEMPVISVSNSCYASDQRGSVTGVYQLVPQNRCRACCRTCDRRASTTPVSSLYLARSVSKESVRSANAHGHLSPSSAMPTHTIPPVFVTTSPTSGSRIIRQSSQPEASTVVCCGGHTCVHPHSGAGPQNLSLRQLRQEHGEGISSIVADSLRINGAMRPFKQVCSFLSFFTIHFVLTFHN